MKITEEQFLLYYEQGLKDSEISKLSGDSASVITKYRNNLGFPPNGRKVISDETFYEWYNKGCNDHEIASITGASSSQITRRRNKFNLPVNKKKNPLEECFIDLYTSGNNDLDISKITGISVSAVQNYRSKLNLPIIGKHNIDQKKLEQLFNEGKADAEIGQILNRSAATIARQRQSMRLLRATKIPNNYQYTEEEFQVILGSLLGDGSLSKMYDNGGTIFKVTHCVKQKEYISYKHSLLKNNSSELKCYQFRDERRKNPDYLEYTFYTKSSNSLNAMYFNWYHPNKVVCKEDLYRIEPLGLAIWYMDDGYKCKPYGGCMICTNSFSRNDLLIIQQMFKGKFDIEVTLNNQNNMVYIPSEEYFKFKKLIEPFIIPSMKYKIE